MAPDRRAHQRRFSAIIDGIHIRTFLEQSAHDFGTARKGGPEQRRPSSLILRVRIRTLPEQFLHFRSAPSLGGVQQLCIEVLTVRGYGETQDHREHPERFFHDHLSGNLAAPGLRVVRAEFQESGNWPSIAPGAAELITIYS